MNPIAAFIAALVALKTELYTRFNASLAKLPPMEQIEGGTDTIASGNKTDPSLNMPMGDSALGAVGQFLAGLIGKGGTGAAAAVTPAPVAAVPSWGPVGEAAAPAQ